MSCQSSHKTFDYSIENSFDFSILKLFITPSDYSKLIRQVLKKIKNKDKIFPAI
jgi:hypothetical protein